MEMKTGMSAHFSYLMTSITEEFSRHTCRERERDKLKFKREVKEIMKNRTKSRNVYELKIILKMSTADMCRAKTQADS